MREMRYIGVLQNGTEVRISPDSPNKSIVISGLCGTGKSQRICDMEQNIIADGGTVIALDLDGSHYTASGANIISAREDGINLNFLDTKILNRPSDVISEYISETANLLLCMTRAGDRQRGILRTAILWALENRGGFSSDFSAIEAGLEEIGTEKALEVRDKIWLLLRCLVFRESPKKIMKRAINVLSFEGFDSDLKMVIVEIFLRNLWKEARIEKSNQITLVIDEFQNLMLSKKSAIMQMLREARKYGVDLILATQTFASFSKDTLSVLNQAAVKLYFRPAMNEVKKLAKQIDDINPEQVILMLKRLKIGESVAIGDLEVGGRHIERAIVVKTNYRKKSGGNSSEQNYICRTISE